MAASQRSKPAAQAPASRGEAAAVSSATVAIGQPSSKSVCSSEAAMPAHTRSTPSAAVAEPAKARSMPSPKRSAARSTAATPSSSLPPRKWK